MVSTTTTSTQGELRWNEVAQAFEGVAIITAAFFTPFMRGPRAHWGLDEAAAARAYPGDELLLDPGWGWTHGVEIDAPLERVWPWVAQMGSDRAGFYSYEWLENLAGCEVHNAQHVHAEWTVRTGSTLYLHPKLPPLPVVAVVPHKYIVACAHSEEPDVEASWLFLLEPLDDGRRTRVISRYRCACSDDVATQLQYGPTLIEPLGFAMDRRMLLGLKERAERT